MEDFDFDQLDDGDQKYDTAFADKDRASGGVLYQLLSSLDGKTAYDQFLIRTDALARTIGLNQNEINNLLQVAVSIPDLEYKNHAAYIFGYLACSKSKDELNQNEVKKVLNNPEYKKIFDEYGIEAPDIIRYARYWKKFLFIRLGRS